MELLRLGERAFWSDGVRQSGQSAQGARPHSGLLRRFPPPRRVSAAKPRFIASAIIVFKRFYYAKNVLLLFDELFLLSVLRSVVKG